MFEHAAGTVHAHVHIHHLALQLRHELGWRERERNALEVLVPLALAAQEHIGYQTVHLVCFCVCLGHFLEFVHPV